MPPNTAPPFDVFPTQNHAVHLAKLHDFVKTHGNQIPPEQQAAVVAHQQKHQSFLYAQQKGLIPPPQPPQQQPPPQMPPPGMPNPMVDSNIPPALPQ